MVRIERDTLGDVNVPDDVYYGPQTVRAMNNFRVSNQRLPIVFIRAQAVIKWASAKPILKLVNEILILEKQSSLWILCNPR